MAHLTERAMIVKLSCHLPQKSKLDREMTDSVVRDHGTDSGMAHVTKQLFCKESLAGLTAAQTALRTFWKSRTLPWERAGADILPSALYMDSMAKHYELARAFERAGEEFLDNRDAIVEAARQRLNGAFRESDYPSRARLAKRIGVTLDAYKLPDGNDFRAGLSDDQEQTIRDEITRNQEEVMAAGVKILWSRVYKVTAEMLEKISRYKEGEVDKRDARTGEVRRVHAVIQTFRDSAVENVRDMVALLEPLNITGDPDLEEMRVKLRDRVCRYDAAALRDSEPLRNAAIEDCQSILDAMAGYIGDSIDLDLDAE